MPASLALISLLGYTYAGHVLSDCILQTTWLVISLVLIYSLLERWLLLERRKLAMKQARERRASKTEAQEKAMQAAGADGPPVAVEEPKLDLITVNAHTRRLIQSAVAFCFLLGFWFIWVDVLPAFNALNRIELWHTVVGVNELVTGADGQITVQRIDQNLPVTLANCLLAAAILIMTAIGARNIPGFLEIAFLQRLPFEPSVRFAVSTLARYVIVIVGIILAFSAIQIGWSKVQFLAAAVTVGLGFGLQEIFANFISGVILLFERPIRVGDVVTIGDVSGVVSRIRMRATTITDWDRKELIVPNKEFITGRLVNWTLSDPILRLIVPVGIAYGSDTELAKETLLNVAKSLPSVLKDPAPVAVFKGFGESSLDFQLLVFFMQGAEPTWSIRDKLHMEIDKAFRKADIEISFPQRDIHIRTIQAALPVEQRGDHEAAESASSGPFAVEDLK